MSDPSNRRALPSLGAAWIALALIHAGLQCLAPRSVIDDPLLPFWARIALLGTEGVALSLLVLAAAGVVRLMAIAGERLPARLRPAGTALRTLLAGLLLIALGASWSTFWFSGQFLDRQGFQFAASNFSSLFGYASRLH